MKFLQQLENLADRFQEDLAEAGREVRKDVMDAFGTAFEDLKDDVESFVSELKAYGAAHPEALFRILRRVQPIFVWKDLALVTRFDDVQEVLARDDVFDVPYAARMKEITDGENFFLGMRDGVRYSRDHTNMLAVVRRTDVEAIVRPVVSNLARMHVQSVSNEMDVVVQLSRRVPTGLVCKYFGLTDIDENRLADWASALFWYLFLDQENDPAVRVRALEASTQLNSYLDERIATRQGELAERTDAADDVISRSLRLARELPGMTNRDIRNNLVGLIIGAIPTTATAAAFALDQLLERPEELRGAHEAAVRGDHELVSRYVFEALRFRPLNPGIFRIANRDFDLASGQIRATRIREGMTVVAATQSAMFDRLELQDPNEFRLDREPRDYLFWGYGLHACFGRYINQVQIPGLLEPLLAKPGLRRASGDRGQLTLSGPFAGSMFVAFGDH